MQLQFSKLIHFNPTLLNISFNKIQLKLLIKIISLVRIFLTYILTNHAMDLNGKISWQLKEFIGEKEKKRKIIANGNHSIKSSTIIRMNRNIKTDTIHLNFHGQKPTKSRLNFLILWEKKILQISLLYKPYLLCVFSIVITNIMSKWMFKSCVFRLFFSLVLHLVRSRRFLATRNLNCKSTNGLQAYVNHLEKLD